MIDSVTSSPPGTSRDFAGRYDCDAKIAGGPRPGKLQLEEI